MTPETSQEAQAITLAKAIMMMVDTSADVRRKCEQLERELKALAIENQRLRAKCDRYEMADIERRRYEEEG